MGICPDCGNHIPKWAHGICYTCERIEGEHRRYGQRRPSPRRSRPNVHKSPKERWKCSICGKRVRADRLAGHRWHAHGLRPHETIGKRRRVRPKFPGNSEVSGKLSGNHTERRICPSCKFAVPEEHFAAHLQHHMRARRSLSKQETASTGPSVAGKLQKVGKLSPRRVKFEAGNYYHIYNRGARRHSLFIEEDNYLYVLRKTKIYVSQFSLAMIAYCLMPNHYHLLLRQDGQTAAGELPKRVFGGYSRAVNRRYGWSGTLFEGRYKANLVGGDSFLLHLCRYIHANPVTAGMVSAPEEWPYSNYQEWLGLRAGSLWDKPFVERFYPDRGEYRLCVREYLQDKEGVPDDVKSYLQRFD